MQTTIINLVFLSFILIGKNLGAQQGGPIDIPIGEAPASDEVDAGSWSPSIKAPRPAPIVNWNRFSAHLNLLMSSEGFGGKVDFLQFLNPWIGFFEELNYERYDDRKEDTRQSETQGRVGLVLHLLPDWLFNPFLRLSTGQLFWDLADQSGNEVFAAYTFGLHTKLTPSFWLTISHDQQYFNGPLPPDKRAKQNLAKNEQSTTSAYFTVVF